MWAGEKIIQISYKLPKITAGDKRHASKNVVEYILGRIF